MNNKNQVPPPSLGEVRERLLDLKREHDSFVHEPSHTDEEWGQRQRSEYIVTQIEEILALIPEDVSPLHEEWAVEFFRGAQPQIRSERIAREWAEADRVAHVLHRFATPWTRVID